VIQTGAPHNFLQLHFPINAPQKNHLYMDSPMDALPLAWSPTGVSSSTSPVVFPSKMGVLPHWLLCLT
jgi:hypothetical protein